MRGLLLAALLAAPAPLPAAPSPMGPLSPVQELYDAGKSDEVIARLSPAELQKLRRRHLPKAYWLLGWSHKKRGETDRALGVFQLAVGLFPKNLELLASLAESMRSAGLDDRARPVYESILKLKPDDAGAHLGLGNIDRSAGLLERASGHYEKTLEAWGDNPDLWRVYAEILTARREHDRALEAVTRSLTLAPDEPRSLGVLAELQWVRGRSSQALASLDKALAKDQDPERRLQRALWLIETGEASRALEDAGRILAADPGNPLALWVRARVSLKRGRPAEARRDLEAASQAARRAPFVASVASAMLAELNQGPLSGR